MNYQGLKEYQRDVLSAFGDWLEELQRQRRECARREAALRGSGLPVEFADRDFPGKAWDALANAGKLRSSRGAMIAPPHCSRVDGRGEPIPHVCLKVPTGGGKTLLGAAMIEAMRPETGVVLWIMPTKAIFQQTWKILSDRTHNCRHRLENACGGKVQLVRQNEVLSGLAVESQLCVMPVMLQATGDARGDFLKISRDSSNLPRFFPDMDDIPGNQEMLKAHPDLDAYDLGSGFEIGAGAVKHSLFNALKLVRPIIVLDEAHKGYSQKQRDKLCEFNPRMILELSATPSSDVSNILADVPGAALQEAQMIKLPLKVHRLKAATWRATLTRAVAELDTLRSAAIQLRGEDGEGRYIRPMMLIRVERTGKKQRDNVHVHAEDVREFLQTRGAHPDEIRVKSSEKDEIGREDLLSKECPIRFVITKDALREGWDCPFAYVLVLLDETTAPRALTQMVGRILRQPDAKKTGTILDNAHVFCFNRAVGDVVRDIKKGLESEGMPDLKYLVDGGDEAEKPAKRRVPIPRREGLTEGDVFLPRVMHGRGKKRRPLCYESDILRDVDWIGISRADLGLTLSAVDKMAETIVEVDFSARPWGRETLELEVEKKLSLAFFARYLGDVIPNPFVAADLAKRALDSLRKAAGGDAGLFDRRFRIADAIKIEAGKLVECHAKRVFCEKLERGEIRLELTMDEKVDFVLDGETDALVGEGESRLRNADDDDLEKSLYQRVYEGAFDNDSEKEFALYADGAAAVAWWHRLAAGKGGYDLQGWRRNLVYPDFVVCFRNGQERRVAILETKGMHLSGNQDTEYKSELLEKLGASNPVALECGDLTLKSGKRERKMVLRVLLQQEKKWQDEFDELARGE